MGGGQPWSEAYEAESRAFDDFCCGGAVWSVIDGE